jgi:AraC family transcriptional regulator
LQDLMLYLAAMHRSAATSPVLRSDLAVERAAFELDTHFSRPLSVPELADAVGINQNHLARCFRRKMGVTIPRYLLQRRMEHARFLLHSTDMPVRVIARRVGMPDPQHFNKQFRKLCGTSPTAWRELSRKGG